MRLWRLLAREDLDADSMNREFRHTLRRWLGTTRWRVPTRQPATVISDAVPRRIVVLDLWDEANDTGGNDPGTGIVARVTGGQPSGDPAIDRLYDSAAIMMQAFAELTRALSPDEPRYWAFSQPGTLMMLHGFDDEPKDGQSFLNAGYVPLANGDDMIQTGYIRRSDRRFNTDPALDPDVIRHEILHGGDHNLAAKAIHTMDSGWIGEGFPDLGALWGRFLEKGTITPDNLWLGAIFATGTAIDPPAALRYLDGKVHVPAHVNHPTLGTDMQRLDWFYTAPNQWDPLFRMIGGSDGFVHLGNITYNTRTVEACRGLIDPGSHLDSLNPTQLMMVSAFAMMLLDQVTQHDSRFKQAIFRSAELQAHLDVLAAQSVFGDRAADVMRRAWRESARIDVEDARVGVARELRRVVPEMSESAIRDIIQHRREVIKANQKQLDRALDLHERLATP